MKRALTFMLAVALMSSCAACGGEIKGEISSQPDDTTTAPLEKGYDYAAVNVEPGSYRILSMQDDYSMHMKFDVAEANGESLNDAIYNRNRYVEDKLGIQIEEILVDLGNFSQNSTGIADMIRKNVEAGDDFCDMTQIPPSNCASMFFDGYFLNLLDYDGFQLDEAWYNQIYNDAVTLKGNLFFGMSSATVGLTDGMWAHFFNEDMMEKHKLEKPYQLVRDGKWTIDKFNEYLAVVTNLNGDSSYTWNKNGNSVYGGTGGYNVFRMMNGMGEVLVDYVDGELSFAAGGERFYQVTDILAKMANLSDGLLYNHGPGTGGELDAETGGYIYPWTVQRSLFQAAEVCKTTLFRNLDFTYGVVPYPKLDTTQERYITAMFQEAAAFAIPVTAKNPERSAVIWDALAYEGMMQVQDIYREYTLEQKGLRNEESIEMLGIIMNSPYVDFGSMFGLTPYAMIKNFFNEITAGGGALASLIETNRTSIEGKLKELNDKLAALK